MKKTAPERFAIDWSSSYATLVIIVLNVAAFAALYAAPHLVDQLLLHPDLGRTLERPWTLVTVFFSHQIPLHLLVNVAVFAVFGLKLERTAGSTAVVLVYVISGLIGSLTMIPLAPLLDWSGHVVGASAAAWGVAAAFAAMYPDERVLGSKAQAWVAALFIGNLVLSLSNPAMSIGAGTHSAGIIVGLLCGYWLRRRR